MSKGELPMMIDEHQMHQAQYGERWLKIIKN